MKLNGFIVPNDLWDLDFNVYERAIVTHIVRKTIGWGKTEDGISISQFHKDLNFSKPKVISTLKKLEAREIIKITREKKANKANDFNKYSLSDNLEKVVRGSKPHLQGVVNDINTQITSNTNNTKQITDRHFKLSKKTAYENTSEKYKNEFMAYCYLIDKANNYEDFILSLEANNYKYTNFVSAYRKWYKLKKENDYKNSFVLPEQHRHLGDEWVIVGKIAINKCTLETKEGKTKQKEASKGVNLNELPKRDIYSLVGSANSLKKQNKKSESYKERLHKIGEIV